MDEKYENPCPKLSANIFSKLSLSWIFPLIWYGKNHEIKAENLYNTLPENRSEPLGKNFEKFWRKAVVNAKKENRQPSLLKVICITYFWSSFHYGLCMILSFVVIRAITPIAFGYYIRYFDYDSNISKEETYMYAFFLILSMYLHGFSFQHGTLKLAEIGIRLRVSCSSLIYKKITKLSSSSAAEISEGFILNLLVDDVARCERFINIIHFVWIIPVQIFVVVYFIWSYVGVASVVGVLSLLLQSLPVQAYFGKIIFKLRTKAAGRTDNRLLLINQIISGIRVIKMYTWEKAFEKIVFLARNSEIDVIGRICYLKSISWATFVFIERTTLFFTVLSYVLLHGHIMSPNKVFSVLQYISNLQLLVNFYFPTLVSSISEVMTATERIQKFLLLDEVDSAVKFLPKNNNTSISIINLSASWSVNPKFDSLTDINIQLLEKKLYVVIGPAGSGKRSFLKLILGELQPTSGEIIVRGKISYASQKPWIFDGSVRSNILFGEPYDEKKYRDVVRACSLATDFTQFPDGDKTTIGGGSALSGGQRARINLARAVYRVADIYLLDDPLSAVDAHVGRQLFEDCFNGLLKDKTRILVTHNTQYLSNEDNIILFNERQIKYEGMFGTFKKDPQYEQQLSICNNIDNCVQLDKATEKEVKMGESEDLLISKIINNDDVTNETEELTVKGKVKWSMMWKYFTFGSSKFTLVILFTCFVLAQSFLTGTDYWVAYLTKQNEDIRKVFANGSIANATHAILFDDSVITTIFDNYESGLSIYTALYIYGFLIFGCVVMSIGKNLLFYKICMNASKNIHNKILVRLLGVPLQLFHQYTSGQIFNRFSKDVGAMDELFTAAALQSFQVLFILIGVMVQSCIINWWIIIPVIILCYICFRIQTIYYENARDISRLETSAKSPVLSYVISSLSGISTIRCCEAQATVNNRFNDLQDHHTSANYLAYVVLATFCMWIDFVCVLLVATVTFSFLMMKDFFSSSTVGLGVTQIMIVFGYTQQMMRQNAEIFTQLVSVDRVFQFTKLDQEKPLVSDICQKSYKDWPTEGRIKFDHVNLRYSGSIKPVLKNISFNVEAGEKIGIVGRTGAGKSSLVAALFKLAEIDGSIQIGGVDIRNLDLHQLRAKISIIPQESVLFSVSLRDNLDPYHEVDDATIWSALNDVELNTVFSSLDESIDKKMLSAGQMQLITLARVLIKNNKILVLDEATANVDHATDVLVQNIIRNKFSNCTVLTIAHRLNTIINSDKVLVMDFGKVVEYDHPHILLQNQNGYFSKMVQNSGAGFDEYLKKMAKNAWDERTAENSSSTTRTKL